MGEMVCNFGAYRPKGQSSFLHVEPQQAFMLEKVLSLQKSTPGSVSDDDPSVKYYSGHLLSLFFCSLILFSAPAAAQENYTAPVKGPLLVTGTFGELRSNHYHAGLDFRASVGTPVYAVREGYVSRIVVSGGGYGQAIYVDHPDGYRSVYAHLETLAPELKDTVRAAQFARERFAVDLKFDSLAYPVTRGQKIGGVGNRGHSFGAHLHFEMREIAGDAPVNPMAFGFSIPDKRSPQIRSLRLYELDGNGHELAGKTYPTGRNFPDTIFVNTPDVALGVKAYDRQDAMPNWNGPFTGGVYVDSVFQFGFEHSRIPFEDTRYLNVLTDYREWNLNTSWFHKLYARPQVQTDFVKAGPGGTRGRLKLPANKPLDGWVSIGDYAGNQSRQDFVLVYRPGNEPRVNFQHQYFIPAQEDESFFERPEFSFYITNQDFYEDLYLEYAELPDASEDRYSQTFHIGDPLTPLHGPATITLSPNRPVPDSLRHKIFIGECGSGGKVSSRRTRLLHTGSDYEAKVRSFGDFALFLDTIPPTVRINSFPTNLSRYSGFSVLVTDDVAGGGLEYRGAVDGEWVLLEYDAKNDKLTHHFTDGNIRPGRHTFELTVTDGRDNTTVWTRNFTR